VTLSVRLGIRLLGKGYRKYSKREWKAVPSLGTNGANKGRLNSAEFRQEKE
jgi:hypothetical protein